MRTASESIIIHRLSRLARVVGLALLTTGAATSCSEDSKTPGESPGIDPGAPVVVITSPARGAYLGNVSQVTITGKATDETPLRSVTINDTPVTFDAAGNFTATVPISPTGTSLFNVKATDLDGKIGEVTHAFSSGPLQQTGARLRNGITQRISGSGLESLAHLSELVMIGDDLGLRIAPLNPVIDVGAGCALNANASISGLDIQAADVQLTPTANGIAMSAEWTGVTIPMHVAYSLLCVTGGHDISLTADRVHMSGRYVVGMSNGRFDVRLEQPQLSFDGLHLDTPGIPPQILSLLDLGNVLGQVLTLVINTLESPLISNLLGGITDVIQLPLPAFDQVLNLDTVAGSVLTTTAGLTLGLDTLFTAQGAPPTSFVAVPNLLSPVLDEVDDLVAVADDTVNSLLASVAGAGDVISIPLTPELATIIDQANLDELLPISIQADGTLQLVVPEVTLDVDFTDGTQATVAVNSVLGVSVGQEPNGALHLIVGNDKTAIDILSTDLPLTQTQLKALTELLTNQIRMLADRLIQAVPIPNGNGLPLQNLSTRGANGYVIIGGRP